METIIYNTLAEYQAANNAIGLALGIDKASTPDLILTYAPANPFPIEAGKFKGKYYLPDPDIAFDKKAGVVEPISKTWVKSIATK